MKKILYVLAALLSALTISSKQDANLYKVKADYILHSDCIEFIIDGEGYIWDIDRTTILPTGGTATVTMDSNRTADKTDDIIIEWR